MNTCFPRDPWEAGTKLGACWGPRCRGCPAWVHHPLGPPSSRKGGGLALQTVEGQFGQWGSRYLVARLQGAASRLPWGGFWPELRGLGGAWWSPGPLPALQGCSQAHPCPPHLCRKREESWMAH